MKTHDLWLAAFLYRKDPTKIINISSKHNKTEFEFGYSADEWRALKLQFINSEESNIKYTIEKLKDLAFQ